jgi:hypothetical protein
MKKITARTLAIRTETLRALVDERLRTAAGGSYKVSGAGCANSSPLVCLGRVG